MFQFEWCSNQKNTSEDLGHDLSGHFISLGVNQQPQFHLDAIFVRK